MLHHALIELVENVRGNSQVDVRIGEILPEWVDNGLDSSFGTGSTIASRIFFKSCQCIQNFGEISVFITIFTEFPQLWPPCRTSRTVPSFAPRNKDLFWVICNKAGKYRKCLAHNTI